LLVYEGICHEVYIRRIIEVISLLWYFI